MHNMSRIKRQKTQHDIQLEIDQQPYDDHLFFDNQPSDNPFLSIDQPSHATRSDLPPSFVDLPLDTTYSSLINAPPWFIDQPSDTTHSDSIHDFQLEIDQQSCASNDDHLFSIDQPSDTTHSDFPLFSIDQPPDTTHRDSIHAPPYTPIDSEKDEIRLLELAPGQYGDQLVIKLVKSNLLHSAEQAYEALSYVWGIKTASQKVLLDGVPVVITENLDCALRHLRYKVMIRTLWIDALCIDQRDVRERNHQVQIMGKIYERAAKVVVWLGAVERGDVYLQAMLGAMQLALSDRRQFSRLFDYVCSVIALTGPRDSSPSSPHACALDALQRLVTCPWFVRLWVVQELALAKNAIVQVGTYCFHWVAFEEFVRMLPYCKVDAAKYPRLVQAACRIVKAPPLAPFLSQLSLTLHLSATDPVLLS